MNKTLYCYQTKRYIYIQRASIFVRYLHFYSVYIKCLRNKMELFLILIGTVNGTIPQCSHYLLQKIFYRRGFQAFQGNILVPNTEKRLKLIYEVLSEVLKKETHLKETSWSFLRLAFHPKNVFG